MQIVINNLLSFLSGLFLINGIPHLVNGLSGRYWPVYSRTLPFVRKAYGEKKLILSPMVNFIWGMINLIIAFAIVWGTGDFKFGLSLNLFSLFTGLLLGGIFLSWNFTEQDD